MSVYSKPEELTETEGREETCCRLRRLRMSSDGSHRASDLEHVLPVTLMQLETHRHTKHTFRQSLPLLTDVERCELYQLHMESV